MSLLPLIFVGKRYRNSPLLNMLCSWFGHAVCLVGRIGYNMV